jgi:hypothetical protein
MDAFRDFLRSLEREIGVYGAPHLGGFDQVERWVKADGLAMARGGSQDAMRYLFKAWRARNPKRGLHFLRTYLQLLWPNAWAVDQLWQKKSQPYGQALYGREELLARGVINIDDDHFLTSRLNVDVAAQEGTGAELLQVSRSLRYVCPAKYVVNLRLLRKSQITFKTASVFSACQALDTAGTLKPFQFGGVTTGLVLAPTFAPLSHVNSAGSLAPLGVVAITGVRVGGVFARSILLATSGPLNN